MLASAPTVVAGRSGGIGRRKGLKIRTRGIAKVIDNMSNPLSRSGVSRFPYCYDNAAYTFNLCQFLSLSNTLIAPVGRDATAYSGGNRAELFPAHPSNFAGI